MATLQRTTRFTVEFDAVLQEQDILVHFERVIEHDSLDVFSDEYEGVKVHFYSAEKDVYVNALDLPGEQRVLVEEMIDGYLAEHSADAALNEKYEDRDEDYERAASRSRNNDFEDTNGKDWT